MRGAIHLGPKGPSFLASTDKKMIPVSLGFIEIEFIGIKQSDPKTAQNRLNI